MNFGGPFSGGYDNLIKTTTFIIFDEMLMARLAPETTLVTDSPIKASTDCCQHASRMHPLRGSGHSLRRGHEAASCREQELESPLAARLTGFIVVDSVLQLAFGNQTFALNSA